MRFNPALPAAFILAAVAFSSCASMPPVTEAKAALTLMDKKDLKNFKLGSSYETNPYLEPQKIWGQEDEFVVLRLDLELLERSKVEIDLSVAGPDGSEVAEFKSFEVMKYYWSNWQGLKADESNRETTLFRTYIPGLRFDGKVGRNSYYMVCRGKNPLPRPFEVVAHAVVNGVSMAELDQVVEPLPPKPKK